MFWCSIFGHNYGITSAFGNYAFCSRCGSTLTIKDPYVLSPGERRWMHGKLMEMNEFNMLEEVVQDDRQILKENTQSKEESAQGTQKRNHTVQSKDPHEQ